MENFKEYLSEGKEHSWKSEGHYTKDGEEWTGPQHAHNGQVMTGEKHTADSQNLYHYKELSKAAQDKVEKKHEKVDEESKGLWANIHAKRKRGEKPAKPGDKEYPKTLDIDEGKQRLDPKCWDGYKKQGTKMKGGKKVNNCVPESFRTRNRLTESKPKTSDYWKL